MFKTERKTPVMQSDVLLCRKKVITGDSRAFLLSITFPNTRPPMFCFVLFLSLARLSVIIIQESGKESSAKSSYAEDFLKTRSVTAFSEYGHK